MWMRGVMLGGVLCVAMATAASAQERAAAPAAAPVVRTMPVQARPSVAVPVQGIPVVGVPVQSYTLGSTEWVVAPVMGSTTDLPGGFTYSYYGGWTPQPRVYQAYGEVDSFPFHGVPYGHAYDRFSWSALSGASRLNRYFYAPVP
jgi:hypothetical protein